MKIAVLGTGMVGEALGTKLVELTHDVKMGSRTANNEKAVAWAKKQGGKAQATTFSDAAKSAEVVFNCISGAATIEALKMAGEEHLSGKVLIDVSNPLDFSKGMPPSLIVCNTDSLAETIQRTFPKAKVVKTLNTMACTLMVNPRSLPESTTVFMAGNDAGAKETVRGLLKQFGWRDDELMDLGDLTAARGLEQYLPIWLRMYGALKTPSFNVKVVKGS